MPKEYRVWITFDVEEEEAGWYAGVWESHTAYPDYDASGKSSLEAMTKLAQRLADKLYELES